MRFGVLMSLLAATVLVVSLRPAIADSGQRGQTGAKPAFHAVLRPDHQTFVIDVWFRNPTAKTAGLGYGDCSFSYVLKVGGQQFSFPTAQPFAFAKLCPGILHVPTIAVRSSLLLFSVPVRGPLAQALKASKSKFSGEFHFKYSLVGQPLNVYVYTTP